MVRIAKIKISNSKRQYAYLCNDLDLQEGDIVYVEDFEEPVYVRDVLEVSEKNNKATKKVLSLAEINKKVITGNKYVDITECNLDCIVDIIYKDTMLKSRYTTAIENAAKSKEIEDFFENHKYIKDLDAFVTDAGELLSNHIIHLALNSKFSDKHCEQLREGFCKAIDLAIKKGYKEIGIPVMPEAYRGYNRNDLYYNLKAVMLKYRCKPKIKIKIYSIYYSDENTRAYELEDERLKLIAKRNRLSIPMNRCMDAMVGCYDRDKSYDTISYNPAAEFDVTNPKDKMKEALYIIDKLYNTVDEIKLDDIYSPGNYLHYLKRNKDYDDRDLYSIMSSSAIKDTYRLVNPRVIKKLEVFRLAITFNLNFTETLQFMSICGYGFSPVSDYNLDFEILKYIALNDGFHESIAEINAHFYNNDKKEICNILNGEEDLAFA